MTHVRPLSVAAFLLTAILISGCGSEPPPPTIPTTLELQDQSKLSVDATSMKIDVQAQAPREYPHVAYRSPIGFEQALNTWVKTHFTLSGNAVYTLTITLREGDIVETLLPMEHGVKAMFKKQQAAEYHARLGITVAIVDPSGKVLASADGTASDSRTSPQDATDADKRITWAAMVTTLFNGLDREMQPRLRMSLAQYVHPAPQ